MSTPDLLLEHFEDSEEDKLTKPKNKRKGGNTMSKENKPKKDFSHFKDIVIAVLVTAVITFIAGMVYQNKFNERVEAKADQIVKQQAVVSREESKN